MKKLSFPLITLFFTGIAVSCYVSACKDPAPPKGIVTVVDSLQVPVSGATVRLTSTGYKGAGVVKDIKQTDASGKVNFEVDLPAILDIYAFKVVNNDSLTGRGVLKLEEDKTTEEKVIIK